MLIYMNISLLIYLIYSLIVVLYIKLNNYFHLLVQIWQITQGMLCPEVAQLKSAMA